MPVTSDVRPWCAARGQYAEDAEAFFRLAAEAAERGAVSVPRAQA